MESTGKERKRTVTVKAGDASGQMALFLEGLPQNFLSEGEDVFRRRNELKAFDVGGEKVAVKKFKLPGVVFRWLQAGTLPTKAEKSFRNAETLLKTGIMTPYPFGYLVKVEGRLLSEDYYACRMEDLPDALGLIRKEDGSVNVSLCEAIACQIAAMHAKGVCHGDLILSNFLVRDEGEGISFSMIDTDRCRFLPRMGRLRCCKDLRRVSRDIPVHRTIVRSYAKARGWDPGMTLFLAWLFKAPFEARKKLLFFTRRIFGHDTQRA